MSETQAPPKTLLDAIRYFSDPDVALAFFAALRWPEGPECPKCGSKGHFFLRTRRLWKCKDCRKQYSAKQGSVFEDSPIGLDKWLVAIWMIANCKNGISSYEIARGLGVTQKTGWFMLHRIRLAMQTGTFRKLSGEIEADESFIGGKARNMHKGKREARIKGRGPDGKAIVAAVLSRHGEVRATVVPTRKKGDLQKLIRDNVDEGSALYTDDLKSYDGLSGEYAHEVINHAEEYVRGSVHTNGLENFWSLLKRALGGTYVSVEPFHLFRYVDEEAFRFNNRKVDDAARFLKTVSGVVGKRLTYTELTGKLLDPQ